jgi:hypothetical protein
MKNLKLPLIGLTLILAVASCKKNDLQEESQPVQTESAASAVITDSVDNIGWQSSANWEASKQENFSVYYFTIDDAKITSDVAENGLVLVYKKNGSAVASLPSEEKGNNSSNYWYHQVTEGNLLILCDAYGAASQPGTNNSFKYFILTPDQLKNLESKGHSSADLMNLTYAEAKGLLNQNN